mgnify:CR=1 FL=1
MNTSKPNLESLAQRLIALAEKAGHLICQIYGEEFNVYEKSDGSPVTRADCQSHFLLKKGLEQLTPQIPTISEEDEISWNLKNPMYWLIDPLDGTKGFIQKVGEFCINIALMENNRPIFGLIHIPVTEETFYGYENKAWRHYRGKAHPIHTRARPSQGMTLLLGNHGGKFKERQELFLKSFSITEVKVIHSAIKFCYVASGQADLYLRFEACSEWDTAAGQILVESAGGSMTRLDGAPFLYGKPRRINEEFMVFGRNS